MSDVEGNYLADVKSLTHACFPRMDALYLYVAEDMNTLTEQCFPAKMQIGFQYLCTSFVI